MSKSFKFTLNISGVRELMQGQAMQGVLDGYANQVLNSAGPGYYKDSYVGKTRANSMIYAKTIEAKKKNLKHNTLLKALGV